MIHTEIDIPANAYKDVERITHASKRRPAQVMRDLITQALCSKTRSTSSRRKLPVEKYFGTMPGLWTRPGQDAADYGQQLRNSMQPRP